MPPSDVSNLYIYPKGSGHIGLHYQFQNSPGKVPFGAANVQALFNLNDHGENNPIARLNDISTWTIADPYNIWNALLLGHKNRAHCCVGYCSPYCPCCI